MNVLSIQKINQSLKSSSNSCRSSLSEVLCPLGQVQTFFWVPKPQGTRASHPEGEVPGWASGACFREETAGPQVTERSQRGYRARFQKPSGERGGNQLFWWHCPKAGFSSAPGLEAECLGDPNKEDPLLASPNFHRLPFLSEEIKAHIPQSAAEGCKCKFTEEFTIFGERVST